MVTIHGYHTRWRCTDTIHGDYTRTPTPISRSLPVKFFDVDCSIPFKDPYGRRTHTVERSASRYLASIELMYKVPNDSKNRKYHTAFSCHRIKYSQEQETISRDDVPIFKSFPLNDPSERFVESCRWKEPHGFEEVNSAIAHGQRFCRIVERTKSG